MNFHSSFSFLAFFFLFVHFLSLFMSLLQFILNFSFLSPEFESKDRQPCGNRCKHVH